jgi:anti-sigma B factor antagonist
VQDSVSPQSLERNAELLRWSVSTHGDGVEIALAGEMDLSNAAAVGDALEAIVNARPATVSVDLAELSFLDSTGLHCLLDAAEKAATVGCQLVVRRPGPTVLRIFAICGVDDILLGRVDGETLKGR